MDSKERDKMLHNNTHYSGCFFLPAEHLLKGLKISCIICRSYHMLSSSKGVQKHPVVCQTFTHTHLMVASKDALSTWLLSRENCRQVTPLICAFSKRRRHCPVWMRHTFTFPSCEPDASISESLLNDMHSTASSIIMKLSYRTEN